MYHHFEFIKELILPNPLIITSVHKGKLLKLKLLMATLWLNFIDLLKF